MNEELIKKIEELANDLKETNKKYQAAIGNKTQEFQAIVDDGNKKVEELNQQIANLRAITNDLNSLIEKTKKESDENLKTVSLLGEKAETLNVSLMDLEKRFINIKDSLSAYEEVKKTIDSFNSKQNAIEVELMTFQKKLETQENYFENTKGSLETLKETDLYKLFVEQNSTLKDTLIDEIIENVIGKVQVKKAVFKSKLELERKGQSSDKE